MPSATAHNPHHQHGLSLVELLVGMTLGLIVITSLGYILLSSRSTYLTQDASARLQETGRQVLDNIGRDLRLAGRVAIIPVTTDTRIEWPSDTNAIEGTDGTSDSLTVRYQLDDTGSNEIEDCNGYSAGTLDDIGTRFDITGTTKHYATVENTYSITDNSIYCDGNGGSSQPMADNVEDLQITYGLDTDGDYAPNQYVNANYFSNSTQNWSQVVSVRICVLVRSEAGATKVSQSYENCSGTSTSSNDTRLRRTFSATYNLRNRNRSSE